MRKEKWNIIIEEEDTEWVTNTMGKGEPRGGHYSDRRLRERERTVTQDLVVCVCVCKFIGRQKIKIL